MGCFLLITKGDVDRLRQSAQRDNVRLLSTARDRETLEQAALIEVIGNSEREIKAAAEYIKSITWEKAKVVTKTHRHHLYPQKHRAFFEQNEINIDSATIRLDETTHLKDVHGRMGKAYNEMWDKFVEKHQESSPTVVRQEALRFSSQLLVVFGLTGEASAYRK
jgi:hypothetical protein